MSQWKEHIPDEDDIQLFNPAKHMFMIVWGKDDPVPALRDIESRKIIAAHLVEAARQLAAMPDEVMIELPR